jgi:gliding motility associated protien GldN
LFWIYFPASRDVLHAAKAFNEKNSAMPFTFDHLLNSRRFNAVIYLEENVYGDREIKEYMKQNAQMQLLESERVKEKIRNFELDMWNY